MNALHRTVVVLATVLCLVAFSYPVIDIVLIQPILEAN